MSVLFETAIVEKRNALNELRSNGMTLQELRLFSIYLSKINPWDKSTRVVRFPLDDFRRIMGLGPDMNIVHFRNAVRGILQKIVEVPNDGGSGYTAFQLFKQAEVEKDRNGEWYVEFDAHDKALPLMFDFKNRYFKYELWNALRLKSTNQVRMYEILKQYEVLGKRELFVSDLRELLGIGKKEYTGRTGWSDFKKYVLDSCRKALSECTDISYTYERGKVGSGGKWLSIVFHISKNPIHKNPLQLDEFINMQPEPEPFAPGVLDSEILNQEMFNPETSVTDELPDELKAIRDILHMAVTDAENLKSIQLALAARHPGNCEAQLQLLSECYARYFRYSGTVKDPCGYIMKLINQIADEHRKEESGHVQAYGNRRRADISSTPPSYDIDLIIEHAKQLQVSGFYPKSSEEKS